MSFRGALATRNLLFLFVFVFFASLPAFCAEPTLDVILAEGNQIQVGSPVDFEISDQKFSSGNYTVMNDQGHVSVNHQNFTGPDVPVVPSSPLYPLIVNGKPYRGVLALSIAPDGIRVTNRVTIEEYLYGVVGQEMPGNILEALKAQAVASRTLAVNAALRGTPIRATVSRQIYGGMQGERPLDNQAVDDTRGLVLTYDGKLIPSPLFSSTCGGKTEDSKDVFGRDMPYLESVSDSDEAGGASSYCTISPYYAWTVTWRALDLQVMMERFGVHGQMLDLIPEDVDPNGRVKTLVVKTTQGQWEFKGNSIRNVLRRADGKPLFSTWFTIDKSEQNGLLSFTANGKGEGHGVGLCQWGAIGMAHAGKDFKEILAHYYTGTALSDLKEIIAKGSKAIYSVARHH